MKCQFCDGEAEVFGVCRQHHLQELRAEADHNEWFEGWARDRYPPPPTPPPAVKVFVGKGFGDRYGAKVLRSVMEDLQRCRNGERNVNLWHAGFRLGCLVREGHADMNEVQGKLLHAGELMELPRHEVRTCVASALKTAIHAG